MVNLFGSGDKEAGPSNDFRVVALLDRGIEEAKILNSDPETQAELYVNLGRMYRMLGKFQKADGLMQRGLDAMKIAVGPDSPKAAEILVQMGLSKADEAKYKDAERLIRQGLEISTRRLTPDDLMVLRALSGLGVVLADSGAFDKAITVLDPLVKRVPAGEEGRYILIESLPALAVSEMNTGHIEIGESLDHRVLVLTRQTLGNSHPRTGFLLSEIASAEANLGRFPEAEALYRETLKIDTSWYGQGSPNTAFCSTVLAMMLTQEGKYAEAVTLLQQAESILEDNFGKVHPYVAVALDTLGNLELRRGDLAAAQTHIERAVMIDRAVKGDADHLTATVKAHLANVFIARGQYERAEPLLRDAVKVFAPLTGTMAAGAARGLLGRVLFREMRYREAEEQLTAAYAILVRSPGKAYVRRLQQLREDLASVYEALHQPDKAARFRTEFTDNEPKKMDVAKRK